MKGYKDAREFVDLIRKALCLQPIVFTEEQKKRDEWLHNLVIELLRRENLKPRDLPKEFYLKMDVVVKRGTAGDIVDLVKEIESWIKIKKMLGEE